MLEVRCCDETGPEASVDLRRRALAGPHEICAEPETLNKHGEHDELGRSRANPPYEVQSVVRGVGMSSNDVERLELVLFGVEGLDGRHGAEDPVEARGALRRVVSIELDERAGEALSDGDDQGNDRE